jgi:hypothetical protein
MTFRSIAVLACGTLLMSLPAFADGWNKRTKITFNQPIEIPGVVLPAGEYVFRLADMQGNRNVVQVLNADENQIFATILAVPHYRMQPADKTIILFEERRRDQPQAIHAWFYPGHRYGQEFVYPKSRALELAQETHQNILSADVKPTETPAELERTRVVEVTPENIEIAVPEVAEAKPAPQLTPPAPAPEPASPSAAETEKLPETASQLPLIALLGVGSLGLAALFGAVRRYLT